MPLQWRICTISTALDSSCLPLSRSSNSYKTDSHWGDLKNEGKKRQSGKWQWNARDEKKKAYWDLMHDVEYQIYISAVRPCTWYTVSPDLSLFIQWTRQTTSTLWCCFVMDVKIMETTGDKWEMMNATVSENTLHSLEYWQIWFERQKQGSRSIGQDLKVINAP